MSRKHDLRLQRAGTVINVTSKMQETGLDDALIQVVALLQEQYGLRFVHRKTWMLSDIVARLKADFPDVPFGDPLPTSFMRPDGGMLSIVDKAEGKQHPVLIVEVKNQGTNDLRTAEGMKIQAMGNAIEQLGKNVIGLRTAMLTEGIMPFVCFGYGWDFHDGSSILDRVMTIAMFGPLNEVNVVPLGDLKQFNRGSYFFREKAWTVAEMTEVMVDVAQRSIHYYLAAYGAGKFE